MTTSHQIYSEIELSSDVLGASRHRLIQLMLDKCLQQMQLTKVFITSQDIQGKHQAIVKATGIIAHLRGSLNFNAEAQAIAEQLDALYAFLERNLLQATLKNDITYVDQACVVLNNIKEGWDGIASKV